jgi:rod shape-determining protein MreC
MYLMKPNFKLKFSAVSVILIALFIALNFAGWANPVRNFFYSISSSMQKSLWLAGNGLSDFFGSIFQARSLKSENEELKSKNWELSAELAKIIILKEENENLHKALDLGLAKEFKLILAQTVSKEVDKDVIIINKGAKDGMSPGMPVLSAQKVLVGKITEVEDRFSKVVLITDKSSSFDARVMPSVSSETVDSPEVLVKIEGVVRGGGGFKAGLDLVPRNLEIKSGDLIMTSSLGGIFPEGILIGAISEVDKNDIEAFQKAKIDLAFDSAELDDIFIIINF